MPSGLFKPSSAKQARRLYLVCSAGFPNYGDEIILRRTLAYLAVHEPNSEIWVDCPNPGPAATLMRNVHRRAHFTDTLFRLCNANSDRDPADIAESVIAAVDNPGRAPSWVAGIEILRKSEIVHVLGGGYLVRMWPQHVGIVAAIGHLAKHGLVRAAMTGVGLRPVADGSDPIWQEYLREFELVSVRDEESLRFCHQLGVGQARLGQDDIFLGGITPLLDKHAASAPPVMLCVQQDQADVDFDTTTDFVRRTVMSLDVPSKQVGFVECIPGFDRRIYTSLVQDFPDARFYSFWDLMRNGFPAGAHQQWISTRLHAHLIAASAGAHGIALNTNGEYYGVKHNAARHYGSSWTIARPTDDAAVFGGPGGLPGAADRFDKTARSQMAAIYR